MKWIVLLEVILVSFYLRELYNNIFNCLAAFVLTNNSKCVLLCGIRFLRSIGVAYAAADLVISRAGAMTCSEIMALGKPSILVFEIFKLIHLICLWSVFFLVLKQ